MSGDWIRIPVDASNLFEQLRALPAAEVSVRFGMGTEGGHRVAVPAVRLVLQGRLHVEGGVDRFGVDLEGRGEGDFAWLARRKGRGRPDYWQGAVERRGHEGPALVLYFTAPFDGIELSLRTLIEFP